jgi:hypothetical protein
MNKSRITALLGAALTAGALTIVAVATGEESGGNNAVKPELSVLSQNGAEVNARLHEQLRSAASGFADDAGRATPTQLADRSESRSIVTGDGVINLASFQDGSGICILHELPRVSATELPGAAGGCADLTRRPYASQVIADQRQPGFVVSGVATDEVQSIRLTTSDGTVHEVAIADNAFTWAASDWSESSAPVTLEVEGAKTTHTEDLSGVVLEG